MDPAAVVVQALVTGAGAGLGGTASAAVTDGYGALKHVLARRLACTRRWRSSRRSRTAAPGAPTR